jgi:hypothetical protein
MESLRWLFQQWNRRFLKSDVAVESYKQQCIRNVACQGVRLVLRYNNHIGYSLKNFKYHDVGKKICAAKTTPQTPTVQSKDILLHS